MSIAKRTYLSILKSGLKILQSDRFYGIPKKQKTPWTLRAFVWKEKISADLFLITRWYNQF